MYYRNNGNSESEILQNEFTKYFQTAIANYKKKRHNKAEMRNSHVFYTDDPDQFRADEITDIFEQSDYLRNQFGNDALIYALSLLNERERNILMMRAVRQKSYEALAKEMDLSYKGVAAIYYRTLEKIRNEMDTGVHKEG